MSSQFKWLCKAEFNSGEVDILYTVMVWAFICEWMMYSLNWVFTTEQISVSASANFVSTCHCPNHHSLKLISEECNWRPTRNKGYVKLIMILTCVIWDWQVFQNVSAISCWITMKHRLMKYWAVCMCHSLWKLVKPNNYFLKGKLVRL